MAPLLNDRDLAFLLYEVLDTEALLARERYAALGVDVDRAQLDRYRVDTITGAYLDPRRPGWFPTKPAY